MLLVANSSIVAIVANISLPFILIAMALKKVKVQLLLGSKRFRALNAGARDQTLREFIFDSPQSISALVILMS